jgi:hypothetical protein
MPAGTPKKQEFKWPLLMCMLLLTTLGDFSFLMHAACWLWLVFGAKGLSKDF